MLGRRSPAGGLPFIASTDAGGRVRLTERSPSGCWVDPRASFDGSHVMVGSSFGRCLDTTVPKDREGERAKARLRSAEGMDRSPGSTRRPRHEGRGRCVSRGSGAGVGCAAAERLGLTPPDAPTMRGYRWDGRRVRGARCRRRHPARWNHRHGPSSRRAGGVRPPIGTVHDRGAVPGSGVLHRDFGPRYPIRPSRMICTCGRLRYGLVGI